MHKQAYKSGCPSIWGSFFVSFCTEVLTFWQTYNDFTVLAHDLRIKERSRKAAQSDRLWHAAQKQQSSNAAEQYLCN